MGALAPAMLKPRGREYLFAPGNIFPHFCMLFLKLPLFVVMLPADLLLLLPRQQPDRVCQLVGELHHLLRAAAPVPAATESMLPPRPTATGNLVQQPRSHVQIIIIIIIIIIMANDI